MKREYGAAFIAMMAGTVMLTATVGTAEFRPEAAGTTPNAQQATMVALDLHQALALAKDQNKNYGVAVQKERQAYAQWWEAMLRFGPTINLQAGYVLDNKPMTTSFDFGGMVQELEMSTNYYAGQLVASQPLFTGLKIYNSVFLAGLRHETALAERMLAGNKLYQEVSDAYYGVVVAEGMLQVTEELVRQMEEHLAVVKAKHREGSASNYDLLRSEVQLANLKPKSLQAKNGYILAKKKLLMVIGMDLETPVNLTEALPTPGQENWADMQSLQEQAQKDRLELQNVDRARRMAGISHTMAVTGNLPNVALTGTWTYYDTHDQDFPPAGENLKHSWEIMLGVQWPLWDNLSAWPKAEAAAAQIRQADLAKEALEQGIRLEVEAAYLALQASLETIDAQEKTVKQAETGYRIATAQYANGMMTNIDLLDAQLALNQAKTNYLQTQYDYIQARIRLKNAIGENLEMLLPARADE
ncbi:TolC family protein [candidate division FCPU426 bacterium]|nr:TolC family protein [candidate division FCPU426 bacterium]